MSAPIDLALLDTAVALLRQAGELTLEYFRHPDLAIDSKGILYAATSPNGKIYRIENGRATEYFLDNLRRMAKGEQLVNEVAI